MDIEDLEKANNIKRKIDKLESFLKLSYDGKLELKVTKTNHGGGIGLETYTKEYIQLIDSDKKEAQSFIEDKLNLLRCGIDNL